MSQQDVERTATRARRILVQDLAIIQIGAFPSPRYRIASVLGRALGALERGAFEPARLPVALVTGLAFVPSLIAGLVFFKLEAAVGLALAVAIGGALHLAAWRLRQPAGESPVVAAVVGVALLGPTTPPLWVAGVALVAGCLELARARLAPRLGLEVGLVAFAAALAAGRGLVQGYVNPGTARALAEPIRLWAQFGGGAAAPINPVRLYVGNVPGPLFATSVMAVVIGAAWLWYARRLSLVVLLTFALGATLPAALMGWNVVYHLDSGPAWFVVALLLADRRRLPGSRAARPLLGVAAGLGTLAFRGSGVGIEAAFLAVAGLQAAVGLVDGAHWLVVNRRDVAGGLRQARTGAQVRLAARRPAA